MRTRSTRTGTNFTELGFGAAGIGNLFTETSGSEAAATIDQAWEAGLRYFDTAPHYGLGLSESRLGEALSTRPRGDYILSTKVGRLLVPNESPSGLDLQAGFAVPDRMTRQWDFSYDGIMRSLESSLERLRSDRVDILLAHDPDRVSEQAGREACRVLISLRDSGVVQCVGLGTNDAGYAAKLLADTDIDIAMIAGRYSLLDQSAADDVLPAAEQSGKSIIAAGVFNSGLLSSANPPPGSLYNYEVASPQVRERANRIAAVCSDHGMTLPEAAIAFPLTHHSVVSVAVGMREPRHVAENVRFYSSSAPTQLWAELQELGLIREDLHLQ